MKKNIINIAVILILFTLVFVSVSQAADKIDRSAEVKRIIIQDDFIGGYQNDLKYNFDLSFNDNEIPYFLSRGIATNTPTLKTNPAQGSAASGDPVEALVTDINSIYQKSDKDSPSNLSNLGIILVTNYGAKGNGSTNDTAALQAAFNAVPENTGALVVIPPGMYLHGNLTIKPKTRIWTPSHWPAILKYNGNTSNVTAIKIAEAKNGEDGYVTIENIHFQNLSKTVTGLTCIGPESIMPYSRIINCSFYRWTKSCINLTKSYGCSVRDCNFNLINGLPMSGDIGTCIYAPSGSHKLEIFNNVTTRCDRFAYVADRSSTSNCEIRGNDIELLGYTLDFKGTTVKNNIYSSYTAIECEKNRGLSITDNYAEGIRGTLIKLDTVKGFRIEANFVEGEEPSGQGGNIVLDKFISLNACKSGQIGSNYVSKYNTLWLEHIHSGTSTDSWIGLLDTNYILNKRGIQVFYPTGTSGVIMPQNGWTPFPETLKFVSPNSVTLQSNFTGGDILKLAIQTGTKIRFKQGGNWKYMVVANPAGGSPVTNNNLGITIFTTGGIDYSFSNMAITDAYFSNMENPEGWPEWFNYIPVGGGKTLIFTITSIDFAKFKVIGQTCYLSFRILGTTGGTADSSLITTLPIKPISTMNTGDFCGSGRCLDTGSTYISSYCYISVSPDVCVNRRYDGAAWGIGTGKAIANQIQYLIDK